MAMPALRVNPVGTPRSVMPIPSVNRNAWPTLFTPTTWPTLLMPLAAPPGPAPRFCQPTPSVYRTALPKSLLVSVATTWPRLLMSVATPDDGLDAGGGGIPGELRDGTA